MWNGVNCTREKGEWLGGWWRFHVIPCLVGGVHGVKEGSGCKVIATWAGEGEGGKVGGGVGGGMNGKRGMQGGGSGGHKDTPRAAAGVASGPTWAGPVATDWTITAPGIGGPRVRPAADSMPGGSRHENTILQQLGLACRPSTCLWWPGA